MFSRHFRNNSAQNPISFADGPIKNPYAVRIVEDYEAHRFVEQEIGLFEWTVWQVLLATNGETGG